MASAKNFLTKDWEAINPDMEFKGNVESLDAYSPNKGQELGAPRKPEGSTLSDEDWSRIAKEKGFAGLYGPKA